MLKTLFFNSFVGAPSHGDKNVCEDINECSSERGGCDMEHGICVNTEGSYSCGCQSGYATAYDTLDEADEELLDNAASWAEQEQGVHEPTLHRVTQAPLLGAVCEPVCDEPCAHGGKCVSPNQCAPCDAGWHGAFCDKEICEISRSYTTEAGELVEDLGCYHGGRCMGIGVDCIDCLGGWTGSACDVVPGGLLVLLVGAAAAMVILPCLVVIFCKRSWLPFQERGIELLLLGGTGALVVTLAGPGAANAGTYGIQLAPFEVQAESDVWAMWLPCTFGYAMWLACLVVRMRNLVTIHLRGGTPLAALFQVGALWLPCLIASSPGGTVSNVLWLLILAAAAVYYAILCCRLRH